MTAGRPTVRSPEMITKLEQAFSLGSTVVGAIFHAGISKTTFYNWCEEDPELKDRLDALKQRPVLKALQTIDKDLGNPQTARWLLEKRHPEFKPVHGITVEDETLPIAGDVLYKKGDV